MPSIDDKGTKTYTTEDRQFVVKDQHLARMYNVVDGINNVLQNASGDDKYADPRLDMLTMLFTTFILDARECEKLLDERDSKIEALEMSIKDVRKLNKKIFRENIKMIAKCFEEFDPFLGLKKKQVVMQVTSEELKQTAKNFGIFECTAAFAEDKSGTLLESLKDAIQEIKDTEKRIDEKEKLLKEQRQKKKAGNDE